MRKFIFLGLLLVLLTLAKVSATQNIPIPVFNPINYTIIEPFTDHIKSKLPLPGVALIKEFEGFYPNAYPDPLSGDKPITIGWGSTKKRDGSNWKLGERITQQEADDLLMLQLENSYLPPLQKIPVWDDLNINQQGALLSFGYNVGPYFYNQPGFKTISRVLRDHQWSKIKQTLLLYRNPGTNVEQGLKRRRLAEADLFLQPFE